MCVHGAPVIDLHLIQNIFQTRLPHVVPGIGSRSTVTLTRIKQLVKMKQIGFSNLAVD